MTHTELLQIVTSQERQIKKLETKLFKMLDELKNKDIQEILSLIDEYYGEVKKEINNIFVFVYQEANLRVNYNIQIKNKATYPITKLDKNEIINKVVNKKFLDLKLEQRLNNHRVQLAEKMKTITLTDISDVALKQEIKASIDVAKSKLKRLVITEGNRIISNATLDAIKDSPYVEKVIFIATLDNRTSKICRKLDGTIMNKDEAIEGVNAPSMHCYCRSVLGDYDEDKSVMESRIARNVATGKSEYLDKYMTYEEWKKFVKYK